MSVHFKHVCYCSQHKKCIELCFLICYLFPLKNLARNKCCLTPTRRINNFKTYAQTLQIFQVARQAPSEMSLKHEGRWFICNSEYMTCHPYLYF